jgi:hypothetical protein
MTNRRPNGCGSCFDQGILVGEDFVLLKPLDFENTDLKGLDRKQIFRHPFDDERAFSRARDRREEWAEALIVALCAMLDRYSDVGGGSAGSPILTTTSAPAPPAPVENEPVTRVAARNRAVAVPVRPGTAGLTTTASRT